MLIPVRDNLYRLDTPFMGLPLSLYVVTGNQTVLIDSGISTTPEEFIFPALDAAGLTPDLLICTHGHVDHFGGNAALRVRYPDMRIALQKDDALWAEDHVRHLHEMYMCMPETWQEPDPEGFLDLSGANCAVDMYLEHGQRIDLGSYQFSLIQTAGHSPGHLTLFDKDAGVAICGDTALGWGALAPGAPKINPYYYDVDRYCEGIETVANLDAELFCTGHSGSLDRDGMADLAVRSLDFVASLEKWCLAALEPDRPQPLADISRRMLDHLEGYEIGFHLNASVQAHLARQCRQSAARVVMVEGRKHYLRAA